MKEKILSVKQVKALNKVISKAYYSMYQMPCLARFKVRKYEHTDDTCILSIGNGIMAAVNAVRVEAMRNANHFYFLATRSFVKRYFIIIKGNDYDRAEACYNNHIQLLEYAEKLCNDAIDVLSELDFDNDIEDTEKEEMLQAFRIQAEAFDRMEREAMTAAIMYFDTVDETDTGSTEKVIVEQAAESGEHIAESGEQVAESGEQVAESGVHTAESGVPVDMESSDDTTDELAEMLELKQL